MFTLFNIESAATFNQQPVDFTVAIADKIQFSRLILTGMPDIIHIRILGNAPSQQHDFEIPFVDKFLQEGGPLDNPYSHINSDLKQALLYNLSGHKTLLVTLIG